MDQTQIKKIVTHLRPHADELVALMLLRKFPEGEEKFPGVSTAEISFLSTGELPDSKTAADFPDTIFLGVGGGIFDEHATKNQERAKNEICATLVAKILGLENDPALKRILHFAKQEDLEGSKVKDAISIMIKFLHSCYPDRYEKVAKWTEVAYLAEYKKDQKELENISDIDEWKAKWQPVTYESAHLALQEQKYPKISWWKEFMVKAIKFQDDNYRAALKQFDTEAKKERFTAYDGKSVLMGVVNSDNEEMNKAGRSRGADLLIIFGSRGNVGIYTSHKRMLDLTYAFILLRMAEQHYAGEIKIKDEKILSEEGLVEGIPWYLIHARNAGYNGSLTTTDIAPTKIPHDKIVELVKEGLKQKYAYK